MPKSNSRGGRNNNPSGRNQYSDWGVLEMAREKPFAATVAAAGAAAAGLFLWSRRAQISEQISNLSDQIGEWKAGYGGNFDTAGLPTDVASETGSDSGTPRTGGRKRQTEIAEEALTLKETGKATA